MDSNFIKPLTSDDRREMREVNKRAKVEKDYAKRVDEVVQKCMREELPFCETCMHNALKKRMKAIQELLTESAMNKNIEVRECDVKIEINPEDFVGEKHMIFIKESSLNEKERGSKYHYPVFIKNYKCKNGHGFSQRVEKKFDDVKKK